MACAAGRVFASGSPVKARDVPARAIGTAMTSSQRRPVRARTITTSPSLLEAVERLGQPQCGQLEFGVRPGRITARQRFRACLYRWTPFGGDLMITTVFTVAACTRASVPGSGNANLAGVAAWHRLSVGLLAGPAARLRPAASRVVERSADRAYARAIWAIARDDGGEQQADRGAAQVAGRQAGDDLTVRLAGDVEQEPGLRPVVLAQAHWPGWACSPRCACRAYRQHVQVLPGQEGSYRRLPGIVRDHPSHDCRTKRLAPSGSNDNYR